MKKLTLTDKRKAINKASTIIAVGSLLLLIFIIIGGSAILTIYSSFNEHWILGVLVSLVWAMLIFGVIAQNTESDKS